jgi:nucleotide-binding universal stress UspA family protein
VNQPQTIAVGFDGSPDAERAVRWAFDLASRLGAHVIVVHAVGLLEHAKRQNVADRLEDLVEALAIDCKLDPAHVRWRLDDGDACSVLLRAADPPISADLLVVGSRGQGVHAGLLLGSVSLELAQHATTPLVIVPTQRSD